jgi:hypothetical protein
MMGRPWMSWCGALPLGITCVLACTPGKPAKGPTQWSPTLDGFGPVRVGMTRHQAETILGAKLTGAGPLPSSWTSEPATTGAQDAPEDPECEYVENQSAVPGVSFMLIDGKIGRIDFIRGQYTTPKGAHIGMSETEVRKLFPGIRVEPNHYDDNDHDLTLTSSDGRFGMVFETDGKVVTSFRVGMLEPVGYVEGCL